MCQPSPFGPAPGHYGVSLVTRVGAPEDNAVPASLYAATRDWHTYVQPKHSKGLFHFGNACIIVQNPRTARLEIRFLPVVSSLMRIPRRYSFFFFYPKLSKLLR